MTGFAINENKGFQITFENGWTVSVQFGHMNYCDNQDILASFDHEEGQTSPNAEIAAFDHRGWYRDDSMTDDVIGWQSPAQVLAFINKIAALSSRPTSGEIEFEKSAGYRDGSDLKREMEG